MAATVPTFRAAVAADDGGTATSAFTVNKPTGTAALDRLVLAFAISPSAVLTLPSGFVLIRSDETGSAQSDFKSWIYAKVAGSSEPSSYTVTWTGVTTGFDAVIASYYHAHQGTPVASGSAGTPDAAFGTTIVAPSVTAGYKQSRVVRIWGTPSSAITAPGSTTVRGSTTGTSFVLADEVVAAAGASGTSTATLASSTHRIGQTVVLESEILIGPRWGVIPI